MDKFSEIDLFITYRFIYKFFFSFKFPGFRVLKILVPTPPLIDDDHGVIHCPALAVLLTVDLFYGVFFF